MSIRRQAQESTSKVRAMKSHKEDQTQAKEWMSSHIVSLHEDETVHAAIQMMVENRISALPIVDRNNHCAGIVTTTDLVGIIYEVDEDVSNTDPIDPLAQRRLIDHLTSTVGHEPISSYMSDQVTTAPESVTLKAAARLMVKEQVHHLPILNDQNELVGILSSMDVLGQVADED